MKSEFFKELHIAFVSSESKWHELKVNTLLQNPNAKQPSINAFLGARYSRSADPVIDIAKEVYVSGKDAAKRLESIFYNYGHKSVGDMADLFLCLENIPIFMAQRFFYSNPVHAGQERSTRYQDFSTPKFVKLPIDLKVSDSLIKEYEAIYFKALDNYSSLKVRTEQEFKKYYQVNDKAAEQAMKARVFDTIRYFLPVGLQTSIGVVMSARSWSERISYYRASSFIVERELGELIYNLLNGTEELFKMGYLPEADGLVRHTAADLSRHKSSNMIKDLLKNEFKASQLKKLQAKTKIEPTAELIDNYLQLKFPTSKMSLTKAQTLKLAQSLSEIIFSNHDHHHQLGNVAQSGSYKLEGITDYGVLKDLIRHRSLEKFIPFLEEELDLDQIMQSETKEMYHLCDYLNNPEFEDLREEYDKRMLSYYNAIKNWYAKAKKSLPKEIVNEFTRYLFNHGYAARYKFYGSFDDLAYTIALRTRNGGHIAYRRLTYEWLIHLAKLDPIWKGLLNKLPRVDALSREQFIDRS
jgi:hypothetical protein